MKTYKATARGHDGKRVIEPGEVFQSDIPKGSWMEEVEDAKADKPAKEAKPAKGEK